MSVEHCETISTGECRIAQRKRYSIVTLPTSNLTRTKLGLNPSLRSERLTTNSLNLRVAIFKPRICLKQYLKFFLWLTESTLLLYSKDRPTAVTAHSHSSFWESYEPHK